MKKNENIFSDSYSVVNQRYIEQISFLIDSKIVRSERHFAMELGMSPQTITEIKGNRQMVTTEILYKTLDRFPTFDISRVFGVEKSLEVRDVPLSTDPIQSMAGWMSRMEKELDILKRKIEYLENNSK